MNLLLFLLLYQYVLAEDMYVVCNMADLSKYEDIDSSEGYEDLQVIIYKSSIKRMHLTYMKTKMGIYNSVLHVLYCSYFIHKIIFATMVLRDRVHHECTATLKKERFLWLPSLQRIQHQCFAEENAKQVNISTNNQT